MEENKRFRNHFSIVFERLGAGFLAVIMLLFYEGVELLGELGAILTDLNKMKEELFLIILAVVGLIVVFAIMVGLQIFRWSKTYISIQEQAVVVEVNTLKRKVNTIGIKNISNINLEQNLFESIVGTCKVKMDTNSMSTADSTDVQIVLKKEKAQEFRKHILGMIVEHMEETEENLTENVMDVQGKEAGAGMETMLMQGLFSMKLIFIPLLVLSIVGMVGIISEALQEGTAAEGILSILSSILLIGVFSASLLWDIIKRFIRYYGFQCYRMGDRLYIRYGLIKKVSYTIPVDKINAVKLVQSPQARLAGRYMAELVNVGLGDDAKEEQSFFVLYDKKDKVLGKIRQLLPEFADGLDTEIHKQSPKVWIIWLWPALVYALAMITVSVVLSEMIREGFMIIIAIIAGITGFVLLCVIGNYFTKGYYVGENSLKLVNGYFARSILIVKYLKIQHVEIEQNFLAKHFHIQKGAIHLLAATINNVHTIPYFPEEDVEKIRERILR